MRLRLILLVAGLFFANVVQAAPWELIGGKREVHYRVFQDNNVMFDIACSANLRVLLAASFISNDTGFTRDFSLWIDGKSVPNYLNPNTPPAIAADYYRFWMQLRDAKKVEVVVDGRRFAISIDGIRDVMPKPYDEDFMCRPINHNGLLIQ